MKKTLLAAALLIFSFLIKNPGLHAQEKLSNYNTSWNAVLPGNALCAPAATSYGFCVATDARNLMGFSSEGKLLWEKKTGRVRNISLTSLPGDFILFYDKANDLIKLINPSGSEIWSKKLSYKLGGAPFAGRDGRFFLYGETKLECFGMNGSCRWSLTTQNQKKLPVQELPDGSIILFLDDEKGQTKGLRVSPFGESLEDITFAGSITNCWSCNDGILLAFSDGAAGLFSVDSQSSLAVNRWVAKVSGNSALFAVKADRSQYRLISITNSDLTVYKIDSKNGKDTASIKLPGIKGGDLKALVYTPSGLFLCDSDNALLIDDDFTEVWSARMPDAVKAKTIDYISYLDEDYLLCFSRNWSINAYHTVQKTSKAANSEKTVLKNIQADYSSFVSMDYSEYNYFNQGSFFNEIKNPAITEEIKKGNFGIKEEKWLGQTLSIARMYSLDSTTSDFGTRVENSVFKTDSAGFENILIQLASLGTLQTQNAAADILSKSTNKSYCKVLMANLCGYDPDGKVLEALEKCSERAGNKDSSYSNTICDAVYSVCLFMGRPAYNRKGKEIIKKFMGAGYTSSARNYARDTLKKIISLEL